DATAMFGQFLPPDMMAYAMGADQATKQSIFQGALSQAQQPYYNLELPGSAYNFEALVPAAQQWMAGQQNRKSNMASIKETLTAAGLGPEAQGFLDLLDTPPIITSLTGGKSAEEISSQFQDYIPDIATSVKDQFVDVSWAMVIGGSIKASIEADDQPLIEAGKAAAGPFSDGFAGPVAAAIIAKIIAALADL
ncbi:MAG: hypothetical protein KDI03_21060, partial [Anaerolineae bacterium]|nr:hypothetical protein [Anaerolineae bacterium]